MKNLNTIQTLAKIGETLSKIAFICSLVGACICAVGMISLPLAGGEIFKIGGVSIYGLMKLEPGEGLKSALVFMLGWLIVCIGEAVLAKFAEIYFKNELKAGTPFTFDSAKELTRLGILTAALPIGCAVLAEILQGIIAGFMDVEIAPSSEICIDNEGSVVLGIMLIVMSVLCRYGAELTDKASNNNANASEDISGGNTHAEN